MAIPRNLYFDLTNEPPFIIFDQLDGPYQTTDAALQEQHRREVFYEFWQHSELWRPARANELKVVEGLGFEGTMEVATKGYLAHRGPGVIAGIVGGPDIAIQTYNPDTVHLCIEFCDTSDWFVFDGGHEKLVKGNLDALCQTLECIRRGLPFPEGKASYKLGTTEGRWPYFEVVIDFEEAEY